MNATRSTMQIVVVLAAMVALSPAAKPTTADEEHDKRQDFSQYDDDRMRRFAAAYLLVEAIELRTLIKLRDLDVDSADYAAVLQGSEGEMEEAIKSVGLSLDAYNEIAEAANDSQQLNENLSRLVNAMIAAIRVGGQVERKDIFIDRGPPGAGVVRTEPKFTYRLWRPGQ